MREKTLYQTERWLKSCLKRKISISERTLIAFLIAGTFGFVGENLFALGNLTEGTRTVGSNGTGNISVGDSGSFNSDSSIIMGNDVTTWTTSDGVKSHHLLVIGEGIRGQNSSYSIIVGKSAGIEGSGEYNFSIGKESGDARKGSYIFSYGQGAGHLSNSSYNFAFGEEAGRKISGANNNYNFAFGFQTGQDMLEGDTDVGGHKGNNIALMYGAGSQTKGSFNMFSGYQAGQKTKGNSNFAFGPQAGKEVTGDENIAMGSHAGQNVTGRVNYALGVNAGQNVAGNGNYAIGENAGQNVKGATNPDSETKGWSNVAIGKAAGNYVIGNHNYSLGENAGKYVGYKMKWDEGVFANTNKDKPDDKNGEYIRPSETNPNKMSGAEHNIALGANSGSYIAGQDNVALGQGAGRYIDGENSGGAANTAIGKGAGNKVYGDENISMGSSAGNDINGHKNIALGVSSASKIKGSKNIAIGVSSSNTTDTFIEKTDTISLGTEADATKNNAIAIGKGAKADGKDSISIGTGNVVSGNKSGAIGDPSYVSGEGTYTIGNDNGTEVDKIAANNAGAFGNSNKMTAAANGSRIVGNSNTVSVENAFVLGNSVTADVANSVYLGKESAAATAAGNTTAGATTEYKTETINATENGRVARTITLGEFAGHTPVGVVTVGAAGKERRIQNVAAGKISATSTDAVNGSQLYALASKMTDIAGAAVAKAIEYFSVNSSADGNKDNSGATGLNAIAIGPNSKAENKNSLAIGDIANAGEYAVALGTETNADGKGAVALGNRIVASGENSTAIGVQVTAKGFQSISIGGLSKAEGNHSIAIGSSSHASKLNSIAIGASSDANKLNSIAIGFNSKSLNNKSIVLGNESIAFGANNITIGNSSVTNNLDSTAVGNDTFTIGTFSTALGSHSSALSDSAIGIGNEASAAANKSVSIGYKSSAEGMYSISFGSDSSAKSDNSVAIGNFAKSNKISGVALGANSVVNTDAGILGYDHFSGKITSTSDIQGLSDEDKQKIPQLETTVLELKSDYESKVNTYLKRLNTLNLELKEAILKKNKDKIDELTDEKENLELDLDEARENYLSNTSVIEYNKLVGAWRSSLGAVSVGDSEKGLTRQITNLAAGTEDTDAVNVAQLKGVTLRVTGDNLATASDAIGKVKLSEQNLAINGTANEIVTKVDKDGQAVTISLADDIKNSIASIANKADKSEIKTYVVEAGKNVVVTPNDTNTKFTVNAEKTVVAAGTGLKLESSEAASEDNNYVNKYTLALSDDLTTKINSANPDTYFHVNTAANNGTGNATTNLGKVNEAAGATALNALTAGVNAKASGLNSVAIGLGANSSIENGVAIGHGASVNNNQGTPGIGGIAIGKNAQSHQMSSAHHEAIVNLGRDKNKMTGGIAIGQDTHARISTIDIGNRDYVGKIGDVDFNSNNLTNTWNYTQAVGTTTVGDNSINAGNFGTIHGAFNIISTTTGNGNSYHNLGKALQGFGSSITGTLNAIEGNEPLIGANPGGGFGGLIEKGLIAMGQKAPATGLIHSGMASHIIGLANTVSKSNGALIFGAGNKISNSYLTPEGANQVITTTAASFLGVQKGPKINELADAFYKYTQEARLGSVGIIGGANKADYALFSNINGVGNTLTGKGAINNLALTEKNTLYSNSSYYDNFSAFNTVTGYENKGTNISHTVLTGSWNEIVNGNKNIVTGNNHIIKGTEADKAEGNIVLGFNTNKAETNFKASADNIVAIGNDIVATENNSVYLGNGSKNAANTATKGMEAYSSDATIITGKTLNFAGGTPTGIVSVGSEGKERRIQNVAAGLISENSTDAINGSQLYAVAKALKNDVTTAVGEIKPVEVLAGTNVTVTPGTKDGDPKVVTYTINAEKTTISSGNETLIKITPTTDSTTNVTDYKIDLADDIKNQIKGAVIRETVVAGSSNLTVTDLKTNTSGGKEFKVDLAKDINLTDKGSLTIGNSVVNNNGLTVGNTTVNDDGLTIVNGPSVTSSGINAADKVISNVKAGEKDTDAVNVSQLKALSQSVQNYGDIVNNNSQRIDTLNSKVNSGLANASAMSALEFQEIGINQAVVAAGVGTFNGSQAVAVGMQTAPTENVRVNVKASVSPRTKNGINTMAAIGASYKFNWK